MAQRQRLEPHKQLAQYASLLEGEGVTIEDVHELDKDTLAELGVTKKFHQIKLLQVFKQLRDA